MTEPAVAIARRPAGLSEAALLRAVRVVLRGERKRAPISLTFLGPTAMRRLNHRHLGHDQPTDVLSFALPIGDLVMGDVYVCRSIAAAEARRRGIPLRQELVRLVIHGVLHVLGYDHPDARGRESSPMWTKQERSLKRALRSRP
jgi:probable rRNA maturation factor